MPIRDSSREAGFSLPETLVAALLLAVFLVGLLQYHQALQQSWRHQWQWRQGWRLAHQQLEAYGAGAVVENRLPSGWLMTRAEQSRTAACRRVTVTVTAPLRHRAVLSRWFCQRDAPLENEQ